VPPFIGDNDAPHWSSAPPQRGLDVLSLTASSTIVRQKLAALVLNPLTVFEMKKITWHTEPSRLPNERSLRSLSCVFAPHARRGTSVEQGRIPGNLSRPISIRYLCVLYSKERSMPDCWVYFVGRDGRFSDR
jgi:hypothetical protein